MTAEEYGSFDGTVSVPIKLLVDIWCELYYGVGGEFGVDDYIAQGNLNSVVDLLASVNALPIPDFGPQLPFGGMCVADDVPCPYQKA